MSFVSIVSVRAYAWMHRYRITSAEEHVQVDATRYVRRVQLQNHTCCECIEQSLNVSHANSACTCWRVQVPSRFQAFPEFRNCATEIEALAPFTV